jgi:hypothetical protein
MSYNRYGAYMMSDEDNKDKVSEGTKDTRIADFVSKLKAHAYTYKDPSQPGAGPGVHVGPMAQELEKSEIGRAAVVDTPEGKMVNTSRLVLPLAGAMAMHEDRLAQLEKGLKARRPTGK